jgi:outer membrane protein
MKRSIILCVCGLLVAGVAVSEQLTTVAVIDAEWVYQHYYSDSQEVRELERLTRQYQDELDSYREQLIELRRRRLSAQNRGDEELVDDLNVEILELEEFYQALGEQRQRDLQIRRRELLSDEFYVSLQDAIEAVALSEGYTIVIKSNAEGLQWWASEVDISELVLERLRQTGIR